MFGQFIKYWPSRVKYYLGKKNENSTRGHLGQQYEVEDDGSKTLLFKKDVITEDGQIETLIVPESELTAEDERVPSTI